MRAERERAEAEASFRNTEVHPVALLRSALNPRRSLDALLRSALNPPKAWNAASLTIAAEEGC